MHNQGVVVFDLDGTLVRCNTFHKFIIFLLFDKRSNLKLTYRAMIIYYSVLRLLKLISHKSLKLNVMRFSGDADDLNIQYFIDCFIQSETSAVCLDEIRNWKKKDVLLVLATAAPLQYSEHIAKKFGFDKVMASNISTSNELFECFRQQKAECVAEYADGRPILAVYSDHDDDIPLFDLAENCILVNPVPKNIYILLEQCESYNMRFIYDV